MDVFSTYLIIKHFHKKLLMVFMCASLFSVAQDIHFSNWQMSPLNLNPASTGMFDGDGRLIFNYRNQWKSVAVPYNTLSFGADFNLKKSLVKNTEEAVGVIFNHDAAGDGKYTITDFKVPVNHKFSFKKDTTFTFGFGVLAGITNIKLDPDKLSYDKQWDGDAYNQGLSNGEDFPKQSKVFADISLGAVVQKAFGCKAKATIGYGASHINKPNISFYNTPGVVLRTKHNEFLQVRYSFNNISAIIFEYYAHQQQKFRENLVGLSYYRTIDPKTNTVFNVGILTRLKDALITTVGLEYTNMRLQLSYDYNYSSFKPATNGRGGFEISFIYIWAKPKIFVPKTQVCPIYM
ncbi:MAG: putative rane protein [Bacteroidetes bacterium]|jgi:type IX secretion system PorP/SprF family membrane protein|nr:putative rane protein [Bacteroidota bacterium]MDF2450611.1 putative rane protein [Bacteroidota bacterium]